MDSSSVKKETRAIIIGGGEKPSLDLFDKYIDENTIVIAADKGLEYAMEYNIKVHYVLGDFDSMSKETLSDVKQGKNLYKGIKTFPCEKDFTDTEAAFNLAVSLEVQEIILLGCTGKRLDHFFANMCTLYKGMKKNIRTYMIDAYNKIFITEKNISLSGEPGEVFSVFAYREDVKNLSIKGAKYPLTDYFLTVGDGLTVSNEFVSENVNITFDTGSLIVVRNLKL